MSLTLGAAAALGVSACGDDERGNVEIEGSTTGSKTATTGTTEDRTATSGTSEEPTETAETTTSP